MERDETEKQYSWLEDIDRTLSSPEGTKALESYLIHCDSLSLLEFIWACDGMKNLVEENPLKTDDLVSCIYKNYIINGSLPMLSNQTVMVIAKCLEAHFERPEPSDFSPISNHVQPRILQPSIFDDAKTEVENYLKTQLFPQFQKAVQNGEVCISIASNSEIDNVRNHCQSEAAHNPSSSRLASHPEAFARTLCEKLEGLMRTRENKPPP